MRPNMSTIASRYLAVPTFAALLALSVGCGDSQLAVEVSCANYCDQKADCDGDVDASECRNECVAAIDDCKEGEVAATLDDLDNCASKTCDDMGSCEIGAAAQCTFGI